MMRPKLIPIQLIRTLDGDTLQAYVNGRKETLRLHSIDTEESAIGYGKPATSIGIRAKHYTRETVQSGTLAIALEIPFDSARDQYGRLLAHIYIDVGDERIHLNHELVRLGFSPYFNKYGNSRLFDLEFRLAQAQAQANQLGIWQEPGRNYWKLMPWWNDRAAILDLARTSSIIIPAEALACDNQWLYISKSSQPKSTKRYLSDILTISYSPFILDFQSKIIGNYTKGIVVHQKLPTKSLRFWFNYQSKVDFQLLKSFQSEKTYGFIGGFVSSYRGLPQIEVVQVARYPQDLQFG